MKVLQRLCDVQAQPQGIRVAAQQAGRQAGKASRVAGRWPERRCLLPPRLLAQLMRGPLCSALHPLLSASPPGPAAGRARTCTDADVAPSSGCTAGLPGFRRGLHAHGGRPATQQSREVSANAFIREASNSGLSRGRYRDRQAGGRAGGQAGRSHSKPERRTAQARCCVACHPLLTQHASCTQSAPQCACKGGSSRQCRRRCGPSQAGDWAPPPLSSLLLLQVKS